MDMVPYPYPLLRLFPFSHLQQLYYHLLYVDVDKLIVTFYNPISYSDNDITL